VNFFAFFGSLVSLAGASGEIFGIDEGVTHGVESLRFFDFLTT
jgi:hypothetical protein